MKFSLLCTDTALSHSSIGAQYPKQNMIKFSQQPCRIGAKFKFHYNYRIETWLGWPSRKYGLLDFKSCFNSLQCFMKMRVSKLVVGSGEPDKCLEEKKIAKVFILSLMSTHDFWNVHIHTQQSKLLQNKQWKKENIYQLRQSKFDHKFKNPKNQWKFFIFCW